MSRHLLYLQISSTKVLFITNQCLLVRRTNYLGSMSSYDISLLSVYVILTLLGTISSISCHTPSEQNRRSLFSPMYATNWVSVVPVIFAGYICNSVEDLFPGRKQKICMLCHVLTYQFLSESMCTSTQVEEVPSSAANAFLLKFWLPTFKSHSQKFCTSSTKSLHCE